ncbi:MAG TPA: hypothetical protein VE258_00005 [Ktedonobacterales bacterium]|nr:hypothetical protein [Ktedonobacterales bacterium]
MSLVGAAVSVHPSSPLSPHELVPATSKAITLAALDRQFVGPGWVTQETGVRGAPPRRAAIGSESRGYWLQQGVRRSWRQCGSLATVVSVYAPWHLLNFLPLPQGHGSFRPGRGTPRAGMVGPTTRLYAFAFLSLILRIFPLVLRRKVAEHQVVLRGARAAILVPERDAPPTTAVAGEAAARFATDVPAPVSGRQRLGPWLAQAFVDERGAEVDL